jgi:uncharacterized damage-inducible protein DinB
MRVLLLALCAGFIGSGLTLTAQSGAAAANPISQAIREAWSDAERNIKESADAMPEAKFAFRPVSTVRTFGQILAHVAGANYQFCSVAKGERAPHAEDEFEKSATTRAAIVKALNDSLAYCDTAYASLDDKKAAEMIGSGGARQARAAALIGNTDHLNEHYGNLVTYFRINGIVPPSSRQR